MDKAKQLADGAAKTGMRMLQHINQALASVDPQLVTGHVREAMAEGDELQAVMDEIMDLTTEQTIVRDKVSLAYDHLREALTEGGAALTASESFIKTHVQSMRNHMDQTLSNLNAASVPITR